MLIEPGAMTLTGAVDAPGGSGDKGERRVVIVDDRERRVGEQH